MNLQGARRILPFYISFGLVQSESVGYSVRLSGIYRFLDSIPALQNALPAYPRSTQAIGMLEVGMSLGSVGL